MSKSDLKKTKKQGQTVHKLQIATLWNRYKIYIKIQGEGLVRTYLTIINPSPISCHIGAMFDLYTVLSSNDQLYPSFPIFPFSVTIQILSSRLPKNGFSQIIGGC